MLGPTSPPQPILLLGCWHNLTGSRCRLRAGVRCLAAQSWFQAWARQQRAVQQAPQGDRSGIREAYLRQGRGQDIAAVGAWARSALRSTTPFVERLVHFWSNHFAVSVDKLLTVGVTGGFEADALRPHVLCRFEDLLLAAVRHPAMLLYLDQASSSGVLVFNRQGHWARSLSVDPWRFAPGWGRFL